MEDKQSQQKNTHDKRVEQDISILSVLIRNFGSGQKWVIGTVIQITGPVSYMVRLKKKRVYIRICGDFHRKVNPVSKLDRYPTPKV